LVKTIKFKVTIPAPLSIRTTAFALAKASSLIKRKHGLSLKTEDKGPLLAEFTCLRGEAQKDLHFYALRAPA